MYSINRCTMMEIWTTMCLSCLHTLPFFVHSLSPALCVCQNRRMWQIHYNYMYYVQLKLMCVGDGRWTMFELQLLVHSQHKFTCLAGSLSLSGNKQQKSLTENYQKGTTKSSEKENENKKSETTTNNSSTSTTIYINNNNNNNNMSRAENKTKNELKKYK